MAFSFALVPVPDSPGRIAVASCPGVGGGLEQDIAALAAAGAGSLVTLLPDDEIERRGFPVALLSRATRAAGLYWAQLPILDFDVPDPEWERSWSALSGRLHAQIAAGAVVALHCRAGLGRSGTVAARLLVERGVAVSEAIALVRAARPGAIETARQTAWLYGLARGEG